MNKFVLIFFIIFIASICHLLPSDASDDRSRIFAGEIITEPDKILKNNREIFGVKASLVVKADRERIWSVLTDYDNFLEIFKSNGLIKIKVIESDGSGAKIELWQYVKKLYLKVHYILDRRYIIDEKTNRRRIVWTRVSSELLKTIDGSWEILDTDDPDSYILIYRSFVDAYIPVSRSIQKGALKEAGAMVSQVRNWIENNR